MDADVAVIGFGPVGAVTAGLLGKHGLRVLVIEKDEAVFPLPRAAHVDHTGLRTITRTWLPRRAPAEDDSQQAA